MAEKETQNPKTGEITKEGEKGSVSGKTVDADSKTELADQIPPEPKQKMSLMDKLFDMIIGVLSLKVQSVRLHHPCDINGETKSAIDVEKHKCKMMLTPFGVMLVAKKYHEDKVQTKTLLTFNNCYSVEFVK